MANHSPHLSGQRFICLLFSGRFWVASLALIPKQEGGKDAKISVRVSDLDALRCCIYTISE